MQERSEAEQRATTGLATGFDEGRPGDVRNVPDVVRLSHTAKVFTSVSSRNFTVGDFRLGEINWGDFNLGDCVM